MPHPYERGYWPPFPSLPVVISHPETNARSALMRGLVDTGADATLVPSAQLQTIKAEEINRARLRSHWGEARLAIVYLVDLQIADHLLPGVEVIADDQSVEALLGRNALNRLTVLLDGPQEQADVLLQRSRRR